jgi:hypothetical protein
MGSLTYGTFVARDHDFCFDGGADEMAYVMAVFFKFFGVTGGTFGLGRVKCLV